MSIEFIHSRAKAIREAVPPQVCEVVLRQVINQTTFKPCGYNGQVDLNVRDSSEVKIRDSTLTKKLWKHIKPHIPPTCDGEKLVGFHKSRVYLLRYVEGQFFQKHYDGSSTNSKGHKSKITVMVYLNDLDETCGGATRFYSEPGARFIEPHQDAPYFDVIPRIGTLVMFTHRLLHEGMPILKGYKYCVRFNALYTDTVNMVNKIKSNG